MGNRMSNIATPMPPIRARFTSKLGIPLSGCKVYTYEPNSNIPKTTWIDIDKTVENTNPILLDAAGEADIFLDGLYQVVVKDRFGFVVYDVEKTGYEQPVFDYSDTKLITWSGRTQEDKNKESITPIDYKAKGDGVTNDTQAFTNLELNHQSVWIDLLGKTYLLDTYPKLNKYFNGNFLIGGISYNSEYNTPYNKNGVFASIGALPNRSYDPLWTDSIVAIGKNAMQNMVDIRTSIAIGANALGKGTKSRDNIAIGDDALYETQARTSSYDQSQKQGTRNIAIGGTAGRFIREGYGNTVVGRGAGQCLQDSNLNIAIGTGALGGFAPVGLSGEIENPFPMNIPSCIAIGVETLYGYQGSDKLLAVGDKALKNARKLTSTLAIGASAGEKLDAEISPNGKNLLWTGIEEGGYSQTGDTITMNFPNLHAATVGCFVGIRLLDGGSQTLQGDIVPVVVTSVNGNTFTCTSPKSINTNGAAQLREVYSLTDASSQNGASVIVGSYAQSGSTRSYRSVAVGAYTAQNAALNSTVLTGFNAGKNSPSVSFSVGLGNSAMSGTGTYSSCIAVGSGTLTTYIDGAAMSGALSSAVAIGTNATVSGDNQIQLGVSTQTTYVYGTVQNRSDLRDKADVRDTQLGLDFINSLRPVDYKWDMREDYIEHETYTEQEWQEYPFSGSVSADDIGLETKIEDGKRWILREVEKTRTIKHEKDGSKKRNRYHHGFIAQEVQSLNADFGGLQDHSVNGGCDVLSIGYDEMIAPLVKAVQELTARVKELEK